MEKQGNELKSIYQLIHHESYKLNKTDEILVTSKVGEKGIIEILHAPKFGPQAFELKYKNGVSIIIFESIRAFLK